MTSNPEYSFAQRVATAISKKGNPVCMGIDPDISAFPAFIINASLRQSGGGANTDQFVQTALCTAYKAAIEETAAILPFVKPNSAFFEQYGVSGMAAFAEISRCAEEAGVLVIADAKRGDIGSTAAAYAKAFLGSVVFGGKEVRGFIADALTVNPYLGFDTMEPFVEQAQRNKRGIFLLLRTSNPGSHHIQLLGAPQGDCPATKVKDWLKERCAVDGALDNSGYSAIGAVVGATHPEELQQLRAELPHTLFLIPGMGAQGATASDVVRGMDSRGQGAIINLSRGIFNAEVMAANDMAEFRGRIKRNVEAAAENIAVALRERAL